MTNTILLALFTAVGVALGNAVFLPTLNRATIKQGLAFGALSGIICFVIYLLVFLLIKLFLLIK